MTTLPVVAGEIVKIDVTNTAGFDHNFYIGDGTALAAGDTSNAQGVPAFASGTKTLTYTVPTSTDGTLAFGCTLPGHYQSMHGDVVIQSGGGPAASAAPGSAVWLPAPASAAP